MINFQAKIKSCYPNLTKGMQKVAKYLLEKPKRFALQTAKQIAKEIGVSETTVIRFAYALKYSGYSEMQREIREYVFEMKSSLATYQEGKQDFNEKERLYEQVMNQDRENILKTSHQIDEADFQKAVEKLFEAENILVAGMRSSHAMAHWFAFAMDLIRGNVRLFRPETDDVILRVSELNENSVFVAFSFHRYASETLKLARVLRKKGVFVIGVTDSPIAPISQYANLVLSVQLPAKSTLDAAPICFSLLNALTSAVALRAPDRFEKRRQVYESQQLKSLFNQGEFEDDGYGFEGKDQEIFNRTRS